MKPISIYELKDGDITCQYGSDMTEMKNATRGFHTLVDEKEFSIIVNGTIEQVKGLCFRKLLCNT